MRAVLTGLLCRYRSFWSEYDAPLTLIAYNGCGFDFHYLFQYWMDHNRLASRPDWRKHLIMKGSRIISFTLETRVNRTWKTVFRTWVCHRSVSTYTT